MKVVASWSGGKDSCFACYKAMLAGYNVVYLLNSVSKSFGRVSSHGITSKLVMLQSQSVGIPLIQMKVTKNNYEEEFKKAVRNLKKSGIKGVVFGDIYLQEHRDWIERICRELEVKAIMPLWGKKPEQIIEGFINAGFEATIVSAKADLLGREWVGRKIDKRFMKDLLREQKIDLCGERGEFHTFVSNGPIFSKRLRLIKNGIVLKKGHWFLDIVESEQAKTCLN